MHLTKVQSSFGHLFGRLASSEFLQNTGAAFFFTFAPAEDLRLNNAS